MKAIDVKGKQQARSIHMMVTSNGNPYMNWQTRILYYTYNKVSRLAKQVEQQCLLPIMIPRSSSVTTKLVLATASGLIMDGG